MVVKVGETYLTKEGYTLLVKEVRSHVAILVEVQCDFKHTLLVRAGNLRKGSVKNRYHRSVAGVGYIGIGEGKVTYKGTLAKPYILWRNMIIRCYQDNNNHSKNYSGRGVFVVSTWHNYQNFFSWWCKQNRRLDKDLKVISSNFYGEETCSLVPNKINNLFTGKDTRRKYRYATGVRRKGVRNYGFEVCKGNGKSYVEYGFTSAEDASNAYLYHKKGYCRELAKQEYSKGAICKLVYENLTNEETLMKLLEFRNEEGIYDK